MRGKKTFVAMCAVLTLVSAAAIVWFSGQDGSQSNMLSQALTAWMLSMLPVDGTAENLEFLNLILRKLAHFGLYFLLGLGLTGIVGQRKRVPAALVVIALGGLFALSDEYHQSFSQGRTPSGWDVLLDTCGVAAGWAVFTAFRRPRVKTHTKN